MLNGLSPTGNFPKRARNWKLTEFFLVGRDRRHQMFQINFQILSDQAPSYGEIGRRNQKTTGLYNEHIRSKDAPDTL